MTRLVLPLCNHLPPADGQTHSVSDIYTLDPINAFEFDGKYFAVDNFEFKPKGIFVDNTGGTSEVRIRIEGINYSWRVPVSAMGRVSIPAAFSGGSIYLTGGGPTPVTFVDYAIVPGLEWPNGQPVNVGNFPATQTVAVSNFPATQQVAGSVGVSNFPAVQDISEAVSVSNFPATQQVSGNVGVNNFPAVQVVSKDISLALNGDCFIGYEYEPGSAGNHSYVLIFNPVGSGKTLYVESASISTQTTGLIAMGAVSAEIGATGNQYINKNLSSAALPVAHVNVGVVASLPGTVFDLFGIGANLPYEMVPIKPFILPPGKGIYAAANTLGDDLGVSFEWYEQ